MKTHYDVLKIGKNCSSKEIREAFLNLSKKYHPDKNGNLDSQKRFVEINEAYMVLSKEHSRRKYDESLQNPHTDYSYYYQSPHRYYTVEQAREYYKARRQSQEFGNGAGSEQFFTPRKVTVTIICVVVVLLNSVFQAREAQKRRDYRNNLAALAFQKTRERNKELGKDNVVRMIMNNTYRGISIAEVKEEYDKLKKK